MVWMPDRAIFDLPEESKRCETWTFLCIITKDQWVGNVKSCSLAVGVCVSFLNGLRNDQLLAARSCCHTICCIVLVRLRCELERTDKDEKNLFFSPLNNISPELSVCLCQHRVEQTAVVLVPQGKECLDDGRGPERWLLEAAYGSLSHNCCRPLDWDSDRLTVFECSPRTTGFFCKVGLILTSFRKVTSIAGFHRGTSVCWVLIHEPCLMFTVIRTYSCMQITCFYSNFLVKNKWTRECRMPVICDQLLQKIHFSYCI